MRGVSEASYQAVSDRFQPVLEAAGADAAELGRQAYAVVDLLDRSAALRRAFTDPARDPGSKADLVVGVLEGKVDGRVVDLVAALAHARWSGEHDLTEALAELAAVSVLAAAEATGDLARVEEELFRLDRLLTGERKLRDALNDRLADPASKGRLVSELLAGKVHPVTLQLVERSAATPRGRRISVTLADLGRLSAYRRRLLVATATVAVALTPQQSERLTRVLADTYGRPVQLNVAVDPQVVGGVRVEIDGDVVDSTVVARLVDVRRRLAG